jgi:flagella basal body P-ring formation protein FlgA
MFHSRRTVAAANAALDERWTSDRRAVFGRQLSSLVVRIAFATIICAMFYSVIATAEDLSAREWQSLSSIRMTAEQFVRDAAAAAGASPAQVFVVADGLDARLRLARCGTALRAFSLNNASLGARNTIGVRCSEGNGPDWTVYVPTAVSIEKQVYVLRRTLPRDAHITLDDVELQTQRLPGLGIGYFSEMSALKEQHLRRGLVAGALVVADALTRDLAIKRGQEVSLVFGSQAFAVRASGIAMADGGIADRIRVQNRSSLKVVEGTIESGNLVRVGM